MTETEMRHALAREDLCRLIAACYYEPDPAFEEEGVFDALLAAARAVDDALVAPARSLGEAFRTTDRQTLLLDYTRLFLGPMEVLAKPYGSVWLDAEKTLMGDSTLAVLDLYREADFEMDEDFKELPDHVAVELEFLYLLIFRGNEALRAGDATRYEQARDLKQRFVARHLGLWVGQFSEAMKAGAQSRFYRELADLTNRFVISELSHSGKR